MKNILLSIFDPEWDGGKTEDRWERWRPTVSLLNHNDLQFDELEIIVQDQHLEMAESAIDDMRSISPSTKINIHHVQFNNPWGFEEVYSALYDITETYDFNPEKINYFAHMSTGTHVSKICLFLMCEAHIIPGNMIQSFPIDLGTNPSEGGWRTIDLSLSRYNRLNSRFNKRQSDGQCFLKSGISTHNAQFNQTIEEIEQVAIKSKHPILITGPTGAGKTLLAKQIYELKKSRHQIEGNFISVNCATLRGDGSMSTLFGHKKGAFTGAMHDRAGLLKSADNGLLFLDEIAELSLEEQAILLTALENGRFYPVGSDKQVQSNFQLIAGTNKHLQQQVKNGLFREDLLARINLWHFTLPGLKDRIDDLEPNIEFELDKFKRMEGKKIRFAKNAYEHYVTFCTSKKAVWNGNFRDLNASITRMATLADDGTININNCEKEISRLTLSWGSNDTLKTESILSNYLPLEQINTMDLFDRMQLENIILICQHHKSIATAGRALFKHSREQRKTINDSDRLRKYLAKFDLDWKLIV